VWQPYGSRNTPDMIETPLRWSTITSGKPCWSLCIPWNSSLIHKFSILFPLSHDTRSCPRLDHRYPHIVFTLVWQVFSTRLMTLYTLWPSHMLVSSYMQLSLSGPRVSIRHVDGQIPLLVHRPQPTPLAYSRDTFSVTQLCDDGWYNQSSLKM
jgi:hypothetical protein